MELVDIGLYGAYALVIIALLGAVVLPLINSLSEPKTLMKIGISVLALGIVFLISWALAGDEVTTLYEKFDLGSTGSKIIGGLLTMMYILLGISIIGIVYTEINKALK